MRLRTSPEADEDIALTHEFGSLTFGVAQADASLAGLLELFDMLVRFPNVGRERDELQPPVRLLRYRSHNVLYRIETDEIIIIRILYHNADWIALLDNDI